MKLDGLDFSGIAKSGSLLQGYCHGAAVASGWWNDLTTGVKLTVDVPQKLMLTVSELAEGMEGHRKNLMDDKLPHRKMLEVELADAAIRIFDLAGALDFDLGGAIAEKMAFNSKRAVTTLYLDTETFSECDLKAHGTHRYAEHPSTEITVAQWAIDDGEPTVSTAPHRAGARR
jgi:hypothetical protein